ncbi:restriction system-associated AAA family ATPase [Ulvibacter litoralis]|uniref:Restriction system-associated AAA family ATPase n=1 Tax=Ulvibacter litoralis TaxID=227084 RepID=A0A1G7JGL5_9FLAO|nr:restriction system-associated AAA family ATPase [Ulvibacter litoralis]GHC65074.1 ABC transporter [Ulvibacter litoralis]SDF23995.1 restriction system-associated AAA family ATPase [Ulvibacter litoralis]
MKLIRLKINQEVGFRSLQQGFEIYFLRDFDYKHAHEFNPNILAGRNGSGKSNILEALANIFYHLDCMYNDYLPDGFLKDEDNERGFDNTIGVVDAYELEYFIDIPISLMNKPISELPKTPINEIKAHILIVKEVGHKPEVKWLNISDYSTKSDDLDKKTVQLLLPKYVLGYSSGENELLSLPFFKTRFLHFDEYADKLRFEEPYGYPPIPEGRLVYLDKEFSQAILLANLLLHNPDSQDAALSPFLENVEIEDIDEFRLIICQDRYLELHEEILRDKEITIEELHDEKRHLTELTSNLKKSIEVLKKCATSFEHRYIEQENDEDGREYLILDYKVTPATKEAFRFHFSEKPLQLFQLFQLMLELNAYAVSEEDKKRVYESKNIFINHDIYPNPLEDDRVLRFKNLWIKKKGIEKSLFTKELSDGEHQFLHSLGLCLLFKNENALFLLDEPETHFNPDWKAKFISNLRHCFSHSSGVMREMLITTHSPYLVSDSESKYVHIFEKDQETKKVTNRFPDFQTLGSSVNKITIKVYDKPDTIGAYANSKIEEFRKELETSEDKEAVLKRVKIEIGESVERVLFINEILDQIEKK